MMLKEFFDKYKLNDKRLLLAFSGGPDSVYLLIHLSFLFKEELNKHIALCYIDYHDSKYVDEEEKIVKYYKAKYNLTIYRRDTFSSKRKNKNFEGWAREFRYKFFAKICKQDKYDGVLTAHQKDDLIETYLIQKRRNILPHHYGLAEVSIIYKTKIYRSILDVNKSEIYKFLNDNNYPYYEDITNTNLVKLRNKIRKDGYSLEEQKKYLEEISKKNDQLSRDLKYLEENLKYPFYFSKYDLLSLENKKRLCHLIAKKIIKKERITTLKEQSFTNLLFEFLKGRKNGKEQLYKDYFMYRTKDYFIVSNLLNKKYLYKVVQRRIYKKKEMTIDLRDPSLFNNLKFPSYITPYNDKMKLGTNLKIKSIKDFLSKQGVPFFLIDFFPVFLDSSFNIQCIPFYKDIKDKIVFNF